MPVTPVLRFGFRNSVAKGGLARTLDMHAADFSRGFGSGDLARKSSVVGDEARRSRRVGGGEAFAAAESVSVAQHPAEAGVGDTAAARRSVPVASLCGRGAAWVL